jgi:hypothetical protein
VIFAPVICELYLALLADCSAARKSGGLKARRIIKIKTFAIF